MFGLGAVICFLGWVSPSIFGQPFSANELQQLTEAGAFSNPAYYGIINGLRETRLSLVSADCGRSLIFILLGAGVIFLYFKGVLKRKSIFVFTLTVVALIDLYSVAHRYVNSDNFTEPADNEVSFKMTDADRAILQDKSNYRVLDVADMSGARSSYFHKTIGGYHAAKLTRYNDLLDKQIYKGNSEVINMLNAKYILSGNEYQLNPDANGNAWFVSGIDYVNSPDAEMKALDSLNTKMRAVADSKFAKTLGNASPKAPATPYMRQATHPIS